MERVDMAFWKETILERRPPFVSAELGGRRVGEVIGLEGVGGRPAVTFITSCEAFSMMAVDVTVGVDKRSSAEDEVTFLRGRGLKSAGSIHGWLRNSRDTWYCLSVVHCISSSHSCKTLNPSGASPTLWDCGNAVLGGWRSISRRNRYVSAGKTGSKSLTFGQSSQNLTLRLSSSKSDKVQRGILRSGSLSKQRLLLKSIIVILSSSPT